MPRVGLDPAAVVEAAAALADRDGLDALTLSRLASELSVRTPSLYAHIGGLDDLRGRLAVRGARALTRELQSTAAGLAGADALHAVASTYRSFALQHPGLYAALQPGGDDPVFSDLVGTVVSVLRGYRLEGDDALHAARIVRAALHGFVLLELTGGFGIPLDLDETFERLIVTLDEGLRNTS